MKKLLLMLAAMAFIAVGCTDDPLEPENPAQDGTEQTPGTGDNGEEPGENPGGENPGGENPGGENPGGENPGGENPGGENPGGENPGGENPGGENPGGENPENPGENPEEPTLPGTELSLAEFVKLPNDDESIYRVSGVVWTVDVEDESTLVLLGDCLYDENMSEAVMPSVVSILNPTWLNDLEPALRPGHVLTIAGNKGTYNNEPDGDAMVLNSQYISHVDYTEPYFTYDMYVNAYLRSEAGEYTFNVYSNSDWTVTTPEGTSVTPSSGNGCAEVTFKYPANANFEDAFYSVVFSYSGKTAEIKFQQEAVRYSLELSENHVEVAADATTASVEVLSNGPWTVNAPEGVTATPESGNGNATVTFTFAENRTKDQIDYEVNISGGNVSYDFIISQAPYSLELSEHHVEVAADATTASVEVLSNGPWTVNAPEGVTATPESGNGNATVVLTFAANETLEAVTRTVTFTTGELTKTFTLTQEAAAAPAEPEFEAGQYWIVESGFVGTPELKSGTYGYMIAEEAWKSSTGVSSTEANAFTFEVAEGGYTIKDSKGRYLYAGKKNDGTYYNTFNASATATENHIWTVAKNADGTYKITNIASTFDVHFGASFKTFECVANVTDFPELVKVENAVPAVTLESSLTFEAEGGSQTITLPEGVSATTSCDNAAFTATSSANVVTVSAAATTEAQSGVLTLVLNYNGFAITKTVDLTQKAAPVAGEEVLLDEDFSSLKTWSTSTVTSLKVNNLTYNTAGGAMYEQKGCIKFGKSTAAANTGVKLPALSSLTSAKTVTLTFKAVSSDSGYTMNVAASAGATVGTLSPKAITKYAGGAINSGADTATKLAEAFAASAAEFSVTIQNVTAQTEITITASGSAKRWYLDDVKIVAQ